MGERFDYLMELERENYKKNVKELLRCRKEYYLERRREEIRANGIKRLKKFVDQEPSKRRVADEHNFEE